MKKFIFLITFGILPACVISQGSDEIININNDLRLIKLSDNAYIHVSYADMPEFGRVPANGLIYTNDDNAFLFDTPWTDTLTMILIEHLDVKMGVKVCGFIPNHWHVDCMGGLGYLQEQEIDSWAYQKTIDIARIKDLPVPAHSFKDSLRLHLGNEEIDCYFLGAAHSLDNIVVWIPSDGILFPGCMVKGLNSANLGNVEDGDIISYPGTIKRLIKIFENSKIVVPGHGQWGGNELLKHTLELASQ